MWYISTWYNKCYGKSKFGVCTWKTSWNLNLGLKNSLQISCFPHSLHENSFVKAVNGLNIVKFNVLFPVLSKLFSFWYTWSLFYFLYSVSKTSFSSFFSFLNEYYCVASFSGSPHLSNLQIMEWTRTESLGRICTDILYLEFKFLISLLFLQSWFKPPPPLTWSTTFVFALFTTSQMTFSYFGICLLPGISSPCWKYSWFAVWILLLSPLWSKVTMLEKSWSDILLRITSFSPYPALVSS